MLAAPKLLGTQFPREDYESSQMTNFVLWVSEKVENPKTKQVSSAEFSFFMHIIIFWGKCVIK